MGRLLESNICNLGIRDELKEALADLGGSPELMNEEHDMGLGNGLQVGRMFSGPWQPWICQLLVMASITSTDCLNRNLKMVNKLKSLMTGEDLATLGNCPSFSSCRKSSSMDMEHDYDDRGDYRPKWVNTKVVDGIPFDIAIVGYNTNTELLRLWESKASEEFDLDVFNQEL